MITEKGTPKFVNYLKLILLYPCLVFLRILFLLLMLIFGTVLGVVAGPIGGAIAFLVGGPGGMLFGAGVGFLLGSLFGGWGTIETWQHNRNAREKLYMRKPISGGPYLYKGLTNQIEIRLQMLSFYIKGDHSRLSYWRRNFLRTLVSV